MIIHVADLSALCAVDACVECQDADCLCLCHETVGPEFVLTDEQEAASWLAADEEYRRLRDV